MSLYKIKIKCISEFVGNIKANTLFGAFCHACSLKYKTNDISKFIEDIVFSDLFFNDNYPIGISNNITQYKKNDYTHILKNDITRTLISRNNETNNVINVLNGTFSNSYFTFFVFSKSIFNYNELKDIIEIMLNFGIGKWRNVGKGQFSLLQIEDFTNCYISKLSQSNKLVALSEFQTNNENELKSILDIGYTIRNARATNGKEQKQLLLLKTGTTFNNDNNFNNMVLITSGHHIFDENSDTYIHSRAILIGV